MKDEGRDGLEAGLYLPVGFVVLRNSRNATCVI